jgi:RNA polymerase sigma factor (sigma-70 family)
MTVEDSDEALIARYARGDVNAFEQLYRRHELAVWRYLKRNVRHDATADDLLQEVWFAVARDAPRYQPSARFVSWLFAIAHHRMIDLIRVRRQHVSLESLLHDGTSVPALTADPRASPSAMAASQDDAAAIGRAIANLPDEQRQAFLLQAEGDLSIEEIAVIAGTSFETAKSRLRYARSKLRDLLKEFA